MLASELRDKLDKFIVASSSDLPVVIRLNNESIGYTAHCEISSIVPGIDWDSGQLWIHSDEKIYRKESHMIEKKIYVSWANGDNEEEKLEMNKLIYSKLLNKYKIAIDEDVNPIDFDIVISSTNGYAHSLYKIIKNNTNLTQDELALICDRGNLCFGYMMDWDKFHIFED